jgi:hypothetical protein
MRIPTAKNRPLAASALTGEVAIDFEGLIDDAQPATRLVTTTYDSSESGRRYRRHAVDQVSGGRSVG